MQQVISQCGCRNLWDMLVLGDRLNLFG